MSQAGTYESDLTKHYAQVRAKLCRPSRDVGFDRTVRPVGTELFYVPMQRKAKPAEKIPPTMPKPGTRRRSQYTVFEGNVNGWAGRKPGELVRPMTMDNRVKLIIKAVAYKHSITLVEIMSRRQCNHIAAARFEAMSRIKDKLPLSLPQIGKYFGGRDHSTVLNAIRKFTSDPERYRPGQLAKKYWRHGFTFEDAE